jgi:hypothetical protein
MPQVVVVAIAWAANWITTAQFIFAVALAGYSTYAQSSARRKARNAYNESLKDRLISVPVVDAARARVYGRVRCADGIIYKATHGTNKENFTLVLALAGHEIDAVEQIYFNDVPVTVDGAGYVTSAPWLKTTVSSGRQSIGPGGTETVLPPDAILSSVGVSTEGSNGDRVAQQTIGFTLAGNTVTPDGLFAGVVRNVTYQIGSTASKARVRAFNGGPGQDLSAVLAGLPGITSAHRFAGIACLVIDLVYDQDAFPMGPPNVSAVVRGAKLLDPRTSITAWTENPALIARDWALYANGGGAAVAELDAASFIAAANACDLSQSFTTVNAAGASSTQVLPLYTAGLVARTDQAPDEVLSEICSAMAGRWAWAGGRLRVRAGAYTAPVATLTEDWVSSAGDIDVVSTVPRTELFNVVVPSIANSAQAYVVAPIPRIAPAEYIAADGGEYPRDVTLTAVTDTAHAAHVCGVMLRDSRQALTVSLSCNMRALALELFDVIAVTLPRFGWAAKPFEVLSWGFSQEGGIKLTLKETDASIFNPDATFSRTDAAPNSSLPNPYAVPGVSPSSITSGNAQLLRQADGTVLSRIRVAWAAVQDEAVRNGGTIEVRYGPADSDPSTYQTETVAGAETQALLTGVQDGRVYAIATRARNKLVAGQWSIQVLHVVQGKSAPPSNVTSLAATGAPGALRITWAPCPDADYALTELRVGTSWATATRIWRGTGSGFEWVTAPGAYNVLARHEDTTGNLSSAVVGASGTALVSDTDSAAAALAAANAAQGTANTASTNATSALSRIAAIDSDGILSRGEKPQAILDWQPLQDEYPGILAQATAYGITAEKDGYYNALVALNSYLGGLSPSWNDTSQDTTIVPAVYRANWADVYAKRQALLNKIAEVAGQRANWTAVNGRPPEDSIRNNIIDLSWWVRGGSMPWGQNSNGGVGQALFTCSPTGTSDLPLGTFGALPGPRGGNDVVLYAQEQSSNGEQAGGWNGGTFATTTGRLDPTKTYRLVVPIRRLGGSAQAYWGGYGLCDINTTGENGNPYFASWGDMQVGRWYLFVGYVFPFGSTGNSNDSAGIWDCKTGQKVVGGSNWNHVSAGMYHHRAYQYYASLNAEQLFGRPMCNLVDGTEPSLREYFEPGAVLNEALLPTIAAERDAAIAAAAADATAKAAAAQSAAQAYAAAQANAADVSARAYADGIVDVEEARAIADATAKANAARTAAEAAAAADATAKANVAATTALWTGVSGSGKPADNATRNDVYRQSSDPGAVPNGSIWLDTSSGKAWQRVAGAWQPYVGTGSVNSNELAAGAAAVVSTSFLAGPVSEANDL